MQNIKKYFMTLALLLTAVTGAWAQTPGVKLFTVPAEWNNDNTPLTAADFPADFVDYSTLSDEKAKAIPNPDPSYSHAIFLFYGFNENKVKFILWVDGTNVGNMTVSREDLYKETTGNHSQIYYTVEPTEWDLTSQDGKTWTLAKMPASDIELQVEYYAESNLFLGKEALADKANIAVTAGETAVAFDDEGKSTTTVTEGNTVTAKFTGKKVLGMKVEKKAKSLIVNPVVGQIIGSDGKNYAYGSLPTGVTAVAKICYVSGSNGLALALTDEESYMNWSTAQTTCAAHTPAITGGTWKLATKDEWDNMINAAGGYSDLRNGFSSVGGTNMKEDYPYWSSTEDGSDNAWSYFFGYGLWGNNLVGYVRACLAF